LTQDLLHRHKWEVLRRGFPHRICRCGALKGASIQAGENTITVGPAGVGDLVRWSATKNAVALGDLGQSVTTGRANGFIDGAVREYAYVGEVQPTVTNEWLPPPEGAVAGNGTRIGQTTFDGASFIARGRIQFNRIIFRITVAVAAPTITIQIFQAPDGSPASVTNRVATVTLFAPAVGNNLATPAEGTVNLVSGVFFVLFGRDSAAGTVTFQTRSVTALELLNQDVDVDTHPTSFTTAIAANTTPATFDPRQTPTGEASASTLDVISAIRFKKV
jgi:hypothetical protein